jgi:hypothetical protein
VGRPLSDDEDFTKAIGKFARGVGVESVLLAQFPAFLKPLVGKLLGTNARVRFLKEKMRPHVMASLKETDDGQVVIQERDIHPVRISLRTLDFANQYKDDALLHLFVAYVAPKYADTAKTPAQLKERILDGVVGRYLGIFFAAVRNSYIAMI